MKTALLGAGPVIFSHLSGRLGLLAGGRMLKGLITGLAEWLPAGSWASAVSR